MPFVLEDMLIAAAIGGGIGGLTNRKNPMKGALMGAGLGALGGGLAPAGLLGGSSAAGGSVVGEAVGAAPVMQSGTAAAFGPTVTGPVPSAFSLLDAPPIGSSMGIGGGLPEVAAQAAKPTGLLGEAMGMVKNAGTVMNAAGQAKQLANQEERPIQPAPIATPMPNNNLGQMVSSYEQQQIARQQMEQQKRLARRKLYGYGVA